MLISAIFTLISSFSSAAAHCSWINTDEQLETWPAFFLLEHSVDGGWTFTVGQ